MKQQEVAKEEAPLTPTVAGNRKNRGVAAEILLQSDNIEEKEEFQRDRWMLNGLKSRPDGSTAKPLGV